MMGEVSPNAPNEFLLPGTIKVSSRALELARGFAETIRNVGHGRWVVVFDWAMHIKIRRSPNSPLEDIGACLTLSAAEPSDVPQAFRHVVDGVEFAVEMPKEIWTALPQRLIDYDETKPFKLVLR